MPKIKGTSTAAMSTSTLDAIISKGRGRDRHKAMQEVDARIKRRSMVTVIRGPMDFACPKCGAPAGEACATPSGSEAKNTHKARIELAD